METIVAFGNREKSQGEREVQLCLVLSLPMVRPNAVLLLTASQWCLGCLEEQPPTPPFLIFSYFIVQWETSSFAHIVCSVQIISKGKHQGS